MKCDDDEGTDEDGIPDGLEFLFGVVADVFELLAAAAADARWNNMVDLLFCMIMYSGFSAAVMFECELPRLGAPFGLFFLDELQIPPAGLKLNKLK